MKKEFFPGWCLMLGLALLGCGINNLVVIGGEKVLEAAIVAIIVGVLLRNLKLIPTIFDAGIKAFEKPLILGIILTNRNLRRTTRGLGIILLILGVLFYGGIFLAGYLIPAQLPLEMIPSSLQSLVLQLAEYILSPLKFFSLSLLIGGILLFTVSFFFGSHGVKEDD